MTTKLVNLLAISSLAILACSFGPTPVNALSNQHANAARHMSRSHSFVKKKRDGQNVQRRCKPRAAAPDAGNQGNNNNSGPPPAPVDNNAQSQPQDQQQPPPPQQQQGSNTPAQNQNPPAQNQNPPAQNQNPPPQPNGGTKLVLAWPNGPDMLGPIPKGIPFYNWSPDVFDKGFDGYPAIPMFWGPKQEGDFASKVNAGNSRVILGFNEPDQAGQSNMSPEDACGLWKQHIQPLRDQGVRAGSPAVTSDPRAKDWYDRFFAAGCDSDFLAVHYYDIDPENFKAYVTNYHNLYKKPMWITEYACQDFNGGAQRSFDEVWAFHKSVKEWMDNNPIVEHYSPFGYMLDMQGVNPFNQLMTKDGLTDLGKFYAFS